MFIDDSGIFNTLNESAESDTVRIREVLAKAIEAKGLNPDEVASLVNISDPEFINELFITARRVKEHIYGKRLVLFAPLYISNLCSNECVYCAFRVRNKAVKRRALAQDEIAAETKTLIDQGHKRVLLVAGEAFPREGFDYVMKAIDTVYSVHSDKGEIRRINVNIAPLTVDEFKRLKERQIGTYQVFQETYHRETYSQVHLAGKKADYDWRITSVDRAMQADIDDVGIGVLFGLYDWRYEVLALMQHVRHLEQKFGVGPHTISVPRLEPAIGSDFAAHPPYQVSDMDFRKIVAVLRLAVPYTGIIMSTRETSAIRRETFALGVSQISAGSRTNPGGYGSLEQYDESQFCLGDHRCLDEVIADIAELGYIPSFCTACYRLGRTGADFMDLAKPGDIRAHCEPNALSTFLEYLLDYATPQTREKGEARIAEILAQSDKVERARAELMLSKVRAGQHDVFI
jgi:2-iminoacetate synthase